MQEYKSDTMAQQAPTQPKFAPSDILGVFAIIADVLVTIMITVGMAMDTKSVTVSILSGVAFFFGFGAFVLMVLSGTLTAIVTNGQNQKTIRMRDAMPYEFAQQAQRSINVVSPLSPPQLPYSQPVAPVLLPEAPSYVPAVPPADEQLKIGSYTFVRALFDDEGKPMPKRILDTHTKSPGLVQYEKPKADVLQYLIGLQMVRENDRKQLFFNKEGYPTLRYCMNAISVGVPAGRVEPPPSTPSLPPYHTSGGGAL